MAKEKQNPYTREDVLRLIEENGGTAKGLDLSDKVFEGSINLRSLDLRGIILKRSVFQSTLDLKLLTRKHSRLEKGRLRRRRIEIGAHFERANLSGADLKEANLANANLKRSFLIAANFEEAILTEANLEKADLTESNFKEAKLYGANLNEADLSGADFEGALLASAHLDKAVLLGTNLEGTSLYYASLKGAYLSEVRLSSDTTLQHVDWGDRILGEERRGEFRWAEDTYRRLKQWYTNAGMYDIAGEFLFREMEAKRKNLRWLQPQERRWLGWWPLRGQKVRLNVYKWLYGYGERPWRVVAWGLLVLFGLALVYFLLRGVAPYTFTLQAFLGSLYYSAVSFTALGYGPWFSAGSVRGWVQGVGAAEAIIGVFMIALFLVTFVRKMIR